MTQWGTQNEGNAFGAYQNVTGHGVEKLGIGIMGSHAAESWIGASPDGLITTRPQSNRKPPFPKDVQHILLPSTKNGILEIKCPYGPSPDLAKPYETMRSYYMPQVRFLKERFEC